MSDISNISRLEEQLAMALIHVPTSVREDLSRAFPALAPYYRGSDLMRLISHQSVTEPRWSDMPRTLEACVQEDSQALESRLQEARTEAYDEGYTHGREAAMEEQSDD